MKNCYEGLGCTPTSHRCSLRFSVYRLGIDLGGTKIECAILGPNGRH